MLDPTARRCRVCQGALVTMLDLGRLRPSEFPLPTDALAAPVPFEFCRCERCGLVQLRHTLPPDQMFRDRYWYRSAVNETMVAELADVVAQAIARVGPIDSTKEFVVDIGANDGTLLAEYKRHEGTRHVPRVGFEPARNLQANLAKHAELVIEDYFPRGLARLPGMNAQVKICSSIACFYDLDEPAKFVEAIAELLHPQGVWIVQFQDLDQMCKANAVDNVCSEHLCYYSLAAIERLIEPYGLMVCDAEVRAINGGSYRLYIAKGDGHDCHPQRAWDGLARVSALRHAEAGCESWETLERFAWRVGQTRQQIQAAVAAVIARGGVVDLYGASTKANTLLQYCGLDGTVIRQAWERSPEKWGRTTVTGIPIVSEDEGRARPPDVLLVGIWQFREAVLQREAEYLERGGRMLFPLPEVDIVQEAAWRPAVSL